MTIYIFPGVIKHIIPAVASTNAVVAGKLICSFYVCMVNINIKLALYTHHLHLLLQGFDKCPLSEHCGTVCGSIYR